MKFSIMNTMLGTVEKLFQGSSKSEKIPHQKTEELRRSIPAAGTGGHQDLEEYQVIQSSIFDGQLVTPPDISPPKKPGEESFPVAKFFLFGENP